MNTRIGSIAWRALTRGTLLVCTFFAGAAMAQGVFPGPAAAPDVAVRITGTVEVMVPYNGGYVLGGSFDQVNGEPRHNIAVIDASGALADGALGWAAIGTDGTVRALAVSGDTVYVGGDFGSIGGQSQAFLARVSLTAPGTVDAAFAPVLDGSVRALATDASGVFAGGVFGNAGGAARERLARFDAASGALDAGWAPGYHDAESVNALALDGSHLYAGGRLKATHPSGGHNRAIARLSAADGALDAGWNARIHPRGGAEVWSIGVDASAVYIAGQFRTLGNGANSTRNNIASLSKTDGSRTTWNPNANAAVRAIALDGAGGVLAAGDFTSIGGASRTFLAHVDASGIASAFSADADRPVRSVLVAAGQGIAGGAFRTLGGDLEEGVARVDLATGARDATFGTAVAGPGEVHAFAFDPEGGVIFGGEFDAVDAGGTSHARANLARLDASLALDTAWTLDVAGAVQAVAVDGTRAYIGGSFLQVADGAGGTAARTRLAAYDISTLAAPALDAAWTPAADAAVTGLVPDANGLYVHGQFTLTPRAYVARLDAAGTADAFDAAVDGPVHALAVDGDTVLLGGEFSTAGGGAHDNLARVHALSDTVTFLHDAGDDAGLSADADGSVQALALDAGALYVGGGFSTLQGQARLGAARISADLVDGWQPGVVGSVQAFAASGGWMYLGGSFASAAGSAHPNIARASTAGNDDQVVDHAWRPGTSDPVSQLAGVGGDGSVLLSGAFESVTGVARGGLAVLGDQGSDLTVVALGAISPEPSVVGQAWTVPFSVANTTQGAPATGSVTITTDAGESCGPVLLDGSGAGSCAITSTTAGTRVVTAGYESGQPDVMDSSASASHEVQAATTTLTVWTGPNPSQTNSVAVASIDLAVAAPGAGSPTGLVQVTSVDALSAAGPSCSIDLDASESSCDLSFTAEGTYTVSADYAGDGNFGAASDSASHVVMDVVVALPTVTTVTPPAAATVVGEAYDVSVAVTAALEPVGTITVDDGADSCQITLLPGDNGQGSCTLASTTAGTKTLGASYAGNPSFEPSSDSDAHTVEAAATLLGLAVQSAVITAGDDAVFTWTLDVVAPGAGSPTGQVTVSAGALACSAPVADGGCTIASMAEGNYDFSASYPGDGNFLADATDGTVPVTVGAGGAVLADVVLRHEIVASGVLSDGSGDLVDYEIEVSNEGGTAANGVLVDLLVPELMVDADWTCTPSGGASCGAASGTGDVALSVDLPPGGSVLVALSTHIVDPDDVGVETAAAATFAGAELSVANNSGTTFYRACSGSELLVVGEFTSLPPHVCGFRDGFEDRGLD